MTPDPIAEIIADLRAMADQIAAKLADYQADQTDPHPVETIDLGDVDEWMFEAEDFR